MLNIRVIKFANKRVKFGPNRYIEYSSFRLKSMTYNMVIKTSYWVSVYGYSCNWRI